MMSKFAASVLLLGSLCLSDESTLAHHSVSVNFDQSKSVEITGTIKEVDIRNPHSQITLDVAKPEGGVVEWFIEWSDRNALIRRAVRYDLLRVGDKVTISLSPSRRLANVGYFRTAILPDGRSLRDCGFGAFRESVANSAKVTCEPVP